MLHTKFQWYQSFGSEDEDFKGFTMGVILITLATLTIGVCIFSERHFVQLMSLQFQ